MPDYKKLKSGTDIRGVAVAYNGQEVTLTDSAVYDITCAFVKWLQDKKNKNVSELVVSVGHDSRISAPRISATVLKALKNMGVTSKFCALASTPAMFMTTVKADCDGAVQITASHHPFYRNGLKFFTSEGGAESSDISVILALAEKGGFEDNRCGKSENMDFMKTYAEILRDLICSKVSDEDYEHPLKGKKIIVDAGNGAGGFFVRDVLEPLGADTSGSQFLEPNGMFPNHIPNPENEEAMQMACNAVKDSGADLGIIFDTDVDRAGAVDSRGNEINRNKLLALAAAIVTDGRPGAYIVTDSVTSDGLKDFIENELHCHHRRFVRGYKNVINEAVRLCKEGKNAPLAGETSGHIAFKENYFLDDGAYLITKIIIKTAQLAKENKTIDDLISTLKEAEESTELRLDIEAEDFRSYGAEVISHIEKCCKNEPEWILAGDSFEGVRVSFKTPETDGWFLLRASVHDPVLPMNIESNAKGGAVKIAQIAYACIKDFTALNLKPIKDFIEKDA